MLEKLLEVIFKPECGICSKKNKNYICDNCYKKLEKYKISFLKDFNKLNLMYIFNYDGKIRDLILNYKFNDMAYLYKMFTNIILKEEEVIKIIKKVDYIISVPMYKGKLRKRGYNQSALIAKELGKKLNIKFIDLIKKIKNTKSQSLLNKEDRKENLKGAFIFKDEYKYLLEGKKILIVDDIYTTGSTINEILNLLNSKLNYYEAYILVIAKD